MWLLGFLTLLATLHGVRGECVDPETADLNVNYALGTQGFFLPYNSTECPSTSERMDEAQCSFTALVRGLEFKNGTFESPPVGCTLVADQMVVYNHNISANITDTDTKDNSTKPLCTARGQKGEVNTVGCPKDTRPLDRSECALVAGANLQLVELEVKLNKRPKGCSFFGGSVEEDAGMIFNELPGDANSVSQPVCASSEVISLMGLEMPPTNSSTYKFMMNVIMGTEDVPVCVYGPPWYAFLSDPIVRKTIKFGLPFLLLQYLSFRSLKQLKFRMWRTRVWIFDRFIQHGDRVDPRWINKLSPVVMAAIILFTIFPFFTIAAVGATAESPEMAVTYTMPILTLIFFLYGFETWKYNLWHVQTTTLLMFGLSSITYFVFQGVMILVSPSVGFFTRSVTFIILNFIAVTELSFVSEEDTFIHPNMFDNLYKEKKPVKSKKDGDHVLLEEDPPFEAQVAVAISQHREGKKESVSIRKFVVGMIGLLALVLYAALMQYFDHGDLAFDILVWVLVLDVLVVLFVDSGGLKKASSKLFVMLSLRFLLIMDDALYVHMAGQTLAYILFGCVLAVAAVDARMPVDGKVVLPSKRGKQNKMRMNVFLSEHDGTLNVDAKATDFGLMSTVKRSGIKTPEFLLFIFTVFYACVVAVNYSRTYEPFYIPCCVGEVRILDKGGEYDISILQFIGVVFVFLVYTQSCSIRTYERHGYQLSWDFAIVYSMNMLLWVGACVASWYVFQSIIVSVTIMVVPTITMFCYITYTHCLLIDWRVVQPPSTRNPPHVGWKVAFLSQNLPWEDYKTMFSVTCTAASLIIAGALVSALMKPWTVGPVITFSLFIIICSLTPLSKFFQTLELDRVDYILFALTAWWTLSLVVFVVVAYELEPMWIGLLLVFGASYFGAIALLMGVYEYIELGSLRWYGKVGGVFLVVVLVGLVSYSHVFNFVLGVIIDVGFVLSVYLFYTLYKWKEANYALNSLSIKAKFYSAAFFTFIYWIIAGLLLEAGMGLDAFWFESAAFGVLVGFMFANGYGVIQRKPKDTRWINAESVIPIPVYFRDNRTQQINQENSHILASLMGVGIVQLWCLFAIVWERQALGLVMSALVTATSYTCYRTASLKMERKFTQIAPYLQETMIRLAHQNVREQAGGGVDKLSKSVFKLILQEGYDEALTLIKHEKHLIQAQLGMARPSTKVRNEKTRKLRNYVRKRNAHKARKRQEAGQEGGEEIDEDSDSVCADSYESSDLSSDDDEPQRRKSKPLSLAMRLQKFKLLKESEEKIALLHCLRYLDTCRFYFFILQTTAARMMIEEATFKQFICWVNKNPKLDHLVRLTPNLNNEDIFRPGGWDVATIETYRAMKEKFLIEVQRETELNDMRRAEEAEAIARKEKMMEEQQQRAAEVAERRRKKEEAKKKIQQVKQAVKAKKRAEKDPDESSELGSDDSLVDEEEEECETRPVRKNLSGDPLQYAEIMRTHSKTNKFVDTAFPADDWSLYYMGKRDPSIRNSAVHLTRISEWLRPEVVAKEGHDLDIVPVLREGGWSLNDVVQGAIGDCYFISALGIMALYEGKYEGKEEGKDVLTQVVKDMMKIQDIDAANDVGAYMFRFFRDGKPWYVIVDDLLPTSGDQLVFSRCTSPGELWVALLEKAFCKFNSCYEAIESGKVHQALVDMTNGSSAEVRLDGTGADGSVVDSSAVWAKLKEAYKSGYLLGVGSNNGNDTENKNGIALGHAYGIVNVFEGDGERLIQLQNPWGAGSIEWEGDWSDKSDKWSRKWQAKLGEKDGGEADGRFWMCYQDFLQYYRNLYICRLLPDPANRISISGEWKGETACGLSKPFSLPTYTIKSSIKQKVYLELTQPDVTRDAVKYRGRSMAYMGFYVLFSDSKRVRALKRDALLVFMKPKNDRSQAAELLLDMPNQSYTVVCGTAKAGMETEFNLTIFCEDAKRLNLTVV